MCRIEAKVDEILKKLQQMQISAVSSSIAAGVVTLSEKIADLPVETTVALDRLENDLIAPSHRKKIVSLN